MLGYGTPENNYLELRAVTRKTGAATDGSIVRRPELVALAAIVVGVVAVAFVLIRRRGRSEEDEE